MNNNKAVYFAAAVTGTPDTDTAALAAITSSGPTFSADKTKVLMRELKKPWHLKDAHEHATSMGFTKKSEVGEHHHYEHPTGQKMVLRVHPRLGVTHWAIHNK